MLHSCSCPPPGTELAMYILMYHQMIDWPRRPARNVPRQPLPPREVSISMKQKEVVEAKYKTASVQKGNYIVIHGIQSDSKASMQSRADTDSLLPLEIWDEITSAIRGLTPVFFIPHEKERENIEEIVAYHHPLTACCSDK
ncbi:photosynthetic NDH subunit of subcomplex B 1, chloroplastic-like isoform X2 [Primulina huaijiensis]|uniref:photosynthetic NDH subunit of subcomplex B 1, chloroplastic-like isoform X2 n=1 Tax=Primulina huaijiensis TaxID=1492673 RepID=UPI003CC7370A